MRSKLQLWLFDGLFLALRLIMWVALLYVAGYLLKADFHIPSWLRIAWPFAIIAGVAWGLQRAAEWHIVRRHAEMGPRSVWEAPPLPPPSWNTSR